MRRRIRANLPIHRHSLPQLVIDAVLVAAAYYLAFQLRFDRGLPTRYERLFDATLPWFVLGCLAVFCLFGFYHKWWRYVGQRDYMAILRAVITATAGLVGVISLTHPVKAPLGKSIVAVNLPAGVVALLFLLLLAFLAGSRFLVHMAFERTLRGFKPKKGARDALIVGAGDGGQLVLREILRNPELGYRPVGFVDDDPRKLGMRLASGLRVLGTTSELPRILDEADPQEVVIAIPSAPGTLRARVVGECRDRGIPVRTLPTVFELLQSGASNVMRQVREVQVEDVLGREPVKMELEQAGAYLTGQTVLVTGAGGSIGSELCRQIARVAPRKLILLDHAEDNLFSVHRELSEDRHFMASVPVLADCKESERMAEIFQTYRPAVVFHAAAYKHVGLMETNPTEAVCNNSLATRTVAEMAGQIGVGKFVLVSTDKAVAPATVMGASKALAEWAVELAAQKHPETSYASVRFGNVLGSLTGSVVPIFRRQIAGGGPVTVTDPNMTRYFMTIPESVQLIIRSGALANSGEVFVLEMGDPVSILELAKDMIRLSGLEPERDIAIEIVGRRPGEKLNEELLNSYELSRPTNAEKIMLAERSVLESEWAKEVFDQVESLIAVGDSSALATKLVELAAARSSLPTVRVSP